MSEHWEVYSCTIGESTAFVVYDHGIRNNLTGFPRHAVRIHVKLKNPNPQGLTQREESDALGEIEDELNAHLAKLGGVFVGRVTVDGSRYFHCFLDAAEEDCQAVADIFGKGHGYEVKWSSVDDPERKSYWDALYPSPEEWQIIQNDKVLDNIRKHGDTLEAERRVDHWIYFTTSDERSNFEKWVKEEGYLVEKYSEKAETKFPCGIQVHRFGSLSDIHAQTLALLHAAKERNGDYDGWETCVVRPSSAVEQPAEMVPAAESPATDLHGGFSLTNALKKLFRK